MTGAIQASDGGFNPLCSAVRTLGYVAHERLHFPRGRVGRRLLLPDGCEVVAFREAYVAPSAGGRVVAGATFHVRFHVAGMSPGANKRFSLLPIPFFVGLPGWQSKIWAVDERTGDAHGIYGWDRVEDAERYSRSFALRFMTRRSVPGSVAYDIWPGPVEDYLGRAGA